MITGYFGVGERRARYTNLILLWLKAFWYGVLIITGFAVFCPEVIGIKNIVQVLFPVTGHAYWYLTAYFMLFLFKPILNSALRCFSKRRLASLLILLIAVVSIPAMLNRDAFGMSKGFSAWWLMVCYLAGGYIRKYGLMEKVRTFQLWCAYIAVVGFDFIKRYIYEWLYFSVKGEIPFYENAMNYMSVTMLAAAVCLLLIFERVKIKNNRLNLILPKISALSFSLYLIHVNSLVWNHLLKGSFRFVVDVNTALSIIEIFFISGVIFAACAVIDLPREALFNKLKVKQRVLIEENRIIEYLKSITTGECNILRKE